MRMTDGGLGGFVAKINAGVLGGIPALWVGAGLWGCVLNEVCARSGVFGVLNQ
jgi:hypothetical protein